jgi:hypothetical protein
VAGAVRAICLAALVRRSPWSGAEAELVQDLQLHSPAALHDCQWKELPIERDEDGRPEIHYTRLYRVFRRWQAADCIDAMFAGSVLKRIHPASNAFQP